ncbi:MAG: hypothetical protein Q8R44_16030 [Novosphingobium sp.]|nr:hypothetical protein [Novosphingobium sp.]
MTLALRWRVPPRAISTRWRGPVGMAQALARYPLLPIAAIIGPPGVQGPPGPIGPMGAPLRLDAPLAATWVLPHPLGRVPTTQVVLANGESVIADISASPAAVTVVFAAPQAGFVLIS